MFKKICSLIFSAALAFVAVVPAFGQAQSNTILEGKDSNILVNLPSVFIKDISLSAEAYIPGQEVKGSFNVINRSSYDVTDIHLKLFIAQKNTKPGPADLYSEFVTDLPSVSIPSKGEKRETFNFTLPSTLPSDARVKVQAFTLSDLALGWDYSDPISTSLKTSLLTFKGVSLNLDNGKYFAPDYGPHIYKDKSPRSLAVDVLVKNDLAYNQEVIPEVNLYRWPKKENENTTTVKGDEITVKKGEEKSIVLDLPNFGYAPGVYTGEFSLLSKDGKNLISPITIRYIVGGDFVTLHSLTSNKSVVGKNESFTVSTSITGSPLDIDNAGEEYQSSRNGSVQVNLEVLNEKDQKVGYSTQEVDVNKVNNIDFPLTAKKESKALYAKIKVNKDGKEILSYEIPLSSNYYDEKSKVTFWDKYKTTALVLLFLIVVGGCIVGLMRSRRNKTLASVAALILAVSVVGSAYAFTYITRQYYQNVRTGALYYLNISPATPADDDRFEPGESFLVSGSLSIPYCSNSSNSTALYHAIQRENGSSVISDYNWGTINYISQSGGPHTFGNSGQTYAGLYMNAPSQYGKYRLMTRTTTTETGGVLCNDGCGSITSEGYQYFYVVPPSPTNLNAVTNCSLKTVSLSWTPVNEEGIAYNVYRSTTPFTSTSASGVVKVASSLTSTAYSDTLASDRPTDTYYAITAFHSASNTESDPAFVTADFNCPSGVCGAGAGDRTTVPSASDTNLCSNSFASSFVGPTLVNGIRRYSWICKGEIASEDVTCLANVTFNGECGTLDGQTNVPQSTNLTADGVLCASHGGVEITSPSNSRNLTWKCKGSDSSKDVSCSATMTGTPTLNPSCGPFADGRQLGLGKVITDFPPEQLCSIGSPVDFTTEMKSNSEGWYRWQCISQSKNAVCSAPYFRAPAVCSTVENECESGYFMEGTTADTSSVHYWECNNRSDGTGSKATCSINLNEAGCGDADGGNYEATPSADLCLSGSTPSAVTSSSNNLYWNWSCSKGTSIKSCQAGKASVATPVISATGWCPATPNGKANIDVHVSSDAGVSPITFNIYRSNTSSTVATTSANLVGTLAGSRDSLLTFTDVNKNTNSTYNYRVVATNSVGTAPNSPTVEVRTPSCTFTPQSIITTAAVWCVGTSPRVGLLAHAQSGTVPVTHKVYRGTASGFTPNLGSPILTLSQSSLEFESNSYSQFDNNVVLGNTYYYKVVSSNSGGAVTSSEFSVTVPATCSGGGDNFCPGTTIPVPADGNCGNTGGGGNGHNGPGPILPTTCPNGDLLPPGGVCPNGCLIVDPANPNPACTVALNPIAASPLRINKGENCSIFFAGSFGVQSYNSDTVCAFKTPAQTMFKFHPSNLSEAGPYSSGVYTAVGLQAETTYTLECWQEDKLGVKVGASQTASATCYINPSNVETSFLQKLKNGFTKAVGAIIFWNK